MSWNPLDWVGWGGEKSETELTQDATDWYVREKDLYERRLQSGYWTQARYDEAMAKLDSQYKTQLWDTDTISTEFTDAAKLGENLGESAAKAGDAVGGGVNRVLSAAGSFAGRVLWGVPAWVWVVVGIGGFFYLGGGVLLRGKIAKAAA